MSSKWVTRESKDSRSFKEQRKSAHPFSNREDRLKPSLGVGSHFSGPEKSTTASHDVQDTNEDEGIRKSNVPDFIDFYSSEAPKKCSSHAADHGVNNVYGRERSDLNNAEDWIKRCIDFYSYSAKPITTNEGSQSKSVQDQHKLPRPISIREDWLELSIGIGSRFSEPDKSSTASHDVHDTNKDKGIQKSNVPDFIDFYSSGGPKKSSSHAADHGIINVKGRDRSDISNAEDWFEQSTKDFYSYSAKPVAINDKHRGSQSKIVHEDLKLKDYSISDGHKDWLKLTLGIGSHYSGSKKSSSTDKGKIIWKFDDDEEDWLKLTLGIGTLYSAYPKKSRSHVACDINKAEGKQRSNFEYNDEWLECSTLGHSSYLPKPITDNESGTAELDFNNTAELDFNSKSNANEAGSGSTRESYCGGSGSPSTVANNATPK